MDEGRIGDAYVRGDLDIVGDMLCPFRLRRGMADRHYIVTLWRFLQPLVLGQVRTNQTAIASHYDIHPDFFLGFLDNQYPLYTQGMFRSTDETLAVAIRRKLDYCYEQLNLQPGLGCLVRICGRSRH
jgi:cyclopropane-fatty-acyl-phospholipid synthase